MSGGGTRNLASLPYSFVFLNESIRCAFFVPEKIFANFVISRPRGASDHKKDFKNEKFRQFAIGAVYHFSFWDGLDEKLWLVKVHKVDAQLQL